MMRPILLAAAAAAMELSVLEDNAGCICVHNQAHSVDNRPPMIRTEPNPNTVNVGALMTVQVPEGLGPGSVFPVDVPGRGACRVTVPPGVFAGQTFTLLHPDYVSN